MERYSDGGIDDKCSIKRVDNIYNELVKGNGVGYGGVNISPRNEYKCVRGGIHWNEVQLMVESINYAPLIHLYKLLKYGI